MRIKPCNVVKVDEHGQSVQEEEYVQTVPVVDRGDHHGDVCNGDEADAFYDCDDTPGCDDDSCKTGG